MPAGSDIDSVQTVWVRMVLLVHCRWWLCLPTTTAYWVVFQLICPTGSERASSQNHRQGGRGLIRSLDVPHQCLVCPPYRVVTPPLGRFTGKEHITIVASSPRAVVLGADTHLDTVHLAVLGDYGKPFGRRRVSRHVRPAITWQSSGPKSFGTVAGSPAWKAPQVMARG